MSASRSLPAAWIVSANSICCGWRLPSPFSASIRERISSEFSGVRSSWLMLARNSDLYFELSASWAAFSSRPRAGELDLGVLDLDVAVLLLEDERLVLQLVVGLAQLERLLLQLLGQRLRLRQQLLGAHVGLDRVDDDADGVGELVQEGLVDLAEGPQRAELDDAEDLLLEHDRHDHEVRRRGVAERRGDLDVVRRDVGEADRLALDRGLAHEPLAEREAVRAALLGLVAVGGDEAQLGLAQRVAVLDEEERAVLGADHRRDLAHDQLGHGLDVALALEHARDPGQVGLQPVLLRVDLRGLAEVLDHLVDVVLELGDLALRPRR